MGTTNNFGMLRLIPDNAFSHDGRWYEIGRTRDVKGTTGFTVDLTRDDNLAAAIPLSAVEEDFGFMHASDLFARFVHIERRGKTWKPARRSA